MNSLLPSFASTPIPSWLFGAVGQPRAVDGDLEVVLVDVVVHARRDLVERVLARGSVGLRA